MLLALLLAAVAFGQDPLDEDPPDPWQAEYEKGLELLRNKRWASAQRHFERFAEEHPTSGFMRAAVDRSGDNCYLGTTPLWTGGPSARRIDVAVMGDGFTIDVSDQNLEEKWAKLCVDVLFNEKAYSDYRTYFNIWFVRLASLEEGVDPNLSDEERKRIEERNRSRARKKKTDFSTALDCKAAGPQGQVMADPGLVMKWLDVAQAERPGCGDDRIVIAFARFGVLGMGGGGIANVGRPDKSVTVHEFGHAFARLLDEYQGNPEPPPPFLAFTLKAPNASLTPDPDKVPWAHMLKRRVKNVGVYEGGATFDKGVWRPARTCAMNAAGANAYCPVCREAAILVIYEYIDPIDEVDPPTGREVTVAVGAAEVLKIVPMKPHSHSLDVRWFVAPLDADTPVPAGRPGVRAPSDEPPPFPVDDRSGSGMQFHFAAGRALEPREAYGEPPPGVESRLGRFKSNVATLPIGKLPLGRHLVTAEVRDPTPHVYKDEKHLLIERASWAVTVKAGG